MRLLSLFLSLITYTLSGQSYNGPESVEFDYANNRYLVANKNNGQIIARSSSGVLSIFASGMSSGPYGIEILGNTLYCCYGGGKIRGYDLTSGAQVADVNLGATFLNGITSDGVKNLYITDFTGKKIYRLNIQTNTFNVFVTGLAKSPNGIIYDGQNNRCVFVNWGTSAPIMAVNLADSTTSTLVTSSFSNMDGIAKDNNGNYYVSCWGNQSIQKYTSAFVAPVSVLTGLSSPADIFYNITTDTLAIPNSGTANNVVFKYMGTATGIDENGDALKVISSHGMLYVSGITGESASLNIYDVAGKVIHSASASNSAAISAYPPGLYFWSVITKSLHKTGKFIIPE